MQPDIISQALVEYGPAGIIMLVLGHLVREMIKEKNARIKALEEQIAEYQRQRDEIYKRVVEKVGQ